MSYALTACSLQVCAVLVRRLTWLTAIMLQNDTDADIYRLSVRNGFITQDQSAALRKAAILLADSALLAFVTFITQHFLGWLAAHFFDKLPLSHHYHLYGGEKKRSIATQTLKTLFSCTGSPSSASWSGLRIIRSLWRNLGETPVSVRLIQFKSSVIWV